MDSKEKIDSDYFAAIFHGIVVRNIKEISSIGLNPFHYIEHEFGFYYFY